MLVTDGRDVLDRHLKAVVPRRLAVPVEIDRSRRGWEPDQVVLLFGRGGPAPLLLHPFPIQGEDLSSLPDLEFEEVLGQDFGLRSLVEGDLDSPQARARGASGPSDASALDRMRG